MPRIRLFLPDLLSSNFVRHSFFPILPLALAGGNPVPVAGIVYRHNSMGDALTKQSNKPLALLQRSACAGDDGWSMPTESAYGGRGSGGATQGMVPVAAVGARTGEGASVGRRRARGPFGRFRSLPPSSLFWPPTSPTSAQLHAVDCLRHPAPHLSGEALLPSRFNYCITDNLCYTATIDTTISALLRPV